MSTCEFCHAKKKWEDEECCKFCEVCQTYKSSALPGWVYDFDIGADVCAACDALQPEEEEEEKPCETCGTECHQCCGLEDEDGHEVWNCRKCCCDKEEEEEEEGEMK